MKVEIKKDGIKLVAIVAGSVDTVTAPELDRSLQANWAGMRELVLDFAGVGYISSAGLRVVMAANQHMAEFSGRVTVLHVRPEVKDIFEMTGFSDFLNFE